MPLRHGCFKPSSRALPPSTRLPSCLLRAHNHILRATTATPSSSSSSSHSTLITSNPTLPPTHISSPPQPEQPAPVPSFSEPPTPSPRYLTIITGGSRGLGAAIARVLATHGPPVPPSSTSPQPPRHQHCTPFAAATSARNTTHPHHPSAPPHATTPTNPPSTSPPGDPVQHDLVLLASDHTRLQRFISNELGAGLLEQRQQQRTVPMEYSHGNGVDKGGASTTADIVTSPHGSRLRIHTLCFDLGDLQSLQANTERLLSPVASASQWADERSTDMYDSAAARAQEYGGGNPAVRATAGGADTSSGGGGGVLPLPPGAYTHVLLVHNAGQVGDLVPLENQSLASIQRQVELNITSFAHLTAALLNTFLHPPVIHDGGLEGSPTHAGQRQQQGQPQPQQRYQEQHPEAEAASPAQAAQSPSLPQLPVSPQCPDLPHTLSMPSPGTDTGRGAAVSLDGGDACASAGVSASLTAPRQETHDLASEAHEETKQQGGGDPPGNRTPPPYDAGESAHHARSEPFRRIITIVNISSVSVDQPYEHFSLYGMGKAARHMLVRSVAHEAALRAEGAGEGGNRHPGQGEEPEEAGRRGGRVAAGDMGNTAAAAPARVRVLSYAPGALDTEMQAAAREALPSGRLKQRFQDNATSGRLVDPRDSAQVLYDILAADSYPNGAHLDYYSVTAGLEASSHPLAA